MTSGSVVPFNGEDCERKIQEKLEQGEKNYLQTLEAVRLEQRQRLAEVEQNYYNQTEESLITSKPPLPTASKRSSSPDFVRERRRRPQYSKSMNIVRRHDEEIAFCPHRTMVNDRTRTIRDFSTEHVERKIRSIWKEFGLDHYMEEQRFVIRREFLPYQFFSSIENAMVEHQQVGLDASPFLNLFNSRTQPIFTMFIDANVSLRSNRKG